MPGYRTHIVGGLVCSAVACGVLVYGQVLALDYANLAVLMAISVLGALFPDIDTDSKGQTIFYLAFLLVDGWLIATRRFELAAWLGLLAVVPVIGHHRGWIHTWWAMCLLPLPVVLVPWLVFGYPADLFARYYGAFVLGYASHLLLDRQW